MRTVVTFSAVLYGLTIATPLERRQGINVDAYEAAASLVTSNQPPVGDSAPQTTVGYDPTTIIEKVVAQVTSAPSDDDINTAAVIAKRAATVCTTRTFNGPRVTAPADTPEAFVAYQPFTDAAVSAAKDENIPEGYNVVTGFVNLPATANAPNYLSYVSSVLAGYNPGQCAAICDGMAGCNAFVIYNERVPLVVSTLTQVPDSNVCPASSTSASATLIKCAFYGVPPTAAQATNSYQFQGKFKVVWTGANAYSKKSVPAVQGFRGPVSFGDYTINVPTPALNYGFLRSETFGANVPFDPSLCAASCLAQTPANAQSGNFNGSACMFFDAHIVYKNGLNGMFTCNYYSIEYDSSNATYSGQTISKDKYTVGYSYGYYLDMDLPSTCSSIFVSTFTPSATATVTVAPVFQRNVPAAVSASAFFSACSAIGVTSTVVTTATVTTTATATPTCTRGVSFTVFHLDTTNPAVSIIWPDAVNNPWTNWDVTGFLKGAKVMGSGVTPVVGSVNKIQNEVPLDLYGITNPQHYGGQYFAAEHTFYIRPTQVGYYTFSSYIADDLLAVWIGNNALSGWTVNNANLIATLFSSGYSNFYVDDKMVNTFIPVRIMWANGPNNYELRYFQIYDPSSNVILSLNPVNSPQIISSCSGISPEVPVLAASVPGQ